MKRFYDIFTLEELYSILYADIFLLKNKNSKQKKILCEKWLKELSFTDLGISSPEKKDILFFRSLERDDYHELFHSVIDSVEVGTYTIIEDYKKTKDKMNLSASRFFLENYRVKERLEKFEPLDKMCCTVRLCYYGFIVDCLSKISFDTLVCFADMQPVEHLAALYFRRIGKRTITLQHGLYVDYGKLDTINVINYIHQPSEYFLAWGEYTAKLISQYHPLTKIIVCGKPNIYQSGMETNVEVKKELPYIMVFLDQSLFDSKNMEMLSIVFQYAQKHNFKVKARFHPHNNKKIYLNRFDRLTESKDFLNAELIVGLTSSLIYEAIALGCQVVQYHHSDVPSIPLPESKRFSNIDELEKAASVCLKQEIPTDTNIYIAYIGEKSKSHYKNFFDQLPPLIEQPKFSIIVPCFNSGATLITCLESIISQFYSNFEILILDAVSKDNTISIADSFAENDPRIKVYSEPDKGVYDAMNKGLNLAKGEWIYFMGSDDIFIDRLVLAKIFKFTQQTDAGLIYGNVKLVGNSMWARHGDIYDGEFTTKKISSKNICHQAIFYRISAIKKIGYFNLKYSVCADWDLNLRMWANFDCQYIDLVVAIFQAGGMSSSIKDHEFGKDLKNKLEVYFSNKKNHLLME